MTWTSLSVGDSDSAQSVVHLQPSRTPDGFSEPRARTCDTDVDMTSRRMAKKQAKVLDPDIPSRMLRAMMKAAETPMDQWITGTHETVRAIGRLDRRTKNR
jgi:hypothetical protein